MKSGCPQVLLVEDNAPIQHMLARRLAHFGYGVTTAGDGFEAIERATRDDFDLILMDLSMPRMDGLQATSQLKAHATTCLIPIIALTAHALPGDRERAISAGCDAYTSKPVDLSALIRQIEGLLAAKGLRCCEESVS